MSRGYLVRPQPHVANLLVELVDIPMSHLYLVLLSLLLHVNILIFGGAREATEPSSFLFWSFLRLLVLKVLSLFFGLLFIVFLELVKLCLVDPIMMRHGLLGIRVLLVLGKHD